jgi:SAM-dependent methyltransferase
MAASPFPFNLAPGGPRLVRKLVHNMPDTDKYTEESSCLYIGSRYGENALAMAELFPGTVLGVDEDSEGLLFARMATAKAGHGKRLAFKFMAPVTLSVPDASLDIAVLDGLLTTYPKSKLLSETHRAIKPGGVLALTSSVWLAEPVPTYVREVWGSIEYQVPTREELRAMLDAAGFEVRAFMDASKELEPFYRQFSGDAHSIVSGGFEGLKHMKSLVKHYKHEIDVYLKLGGRKYMGYAAVIAIKREIAAG